MLKNILMPAMIGAAVALTGPAFADSMKDKSKALYKESQPKANAAVKDEAVKPNAEMNKKIYKETPKDAGDAVKDKAVNADAKMNKNLYKNSQKTGVPTDMKKTN